MDIFLIVLRVSVVFGIIFTRSWGSQGCQLVPFWRYWGTLGVHFGVLGWPLASILGVRGYPWAPLGAQAVPKTPLLFYGRAILNDLAPKACPKGFQNEAKIVKKTVKN